MSPLPPSLPLRPGWQSSEFYATVVSQLLSLLVIGGVITTNDRVTVEGAAVTGIAALIALISSAKIVCNYIASRSQLKQQVLSNDAVDRAHFVTRRLEQLQVQENARAGMRNPILPALFLALALGGLASPVQAQPQAGVTTTALAGAS